MSYDIFPDSDINWGSSTQANNYRSALNKLMKLSRMEEHVKTYRPQLLVLTGNPTARQPLVDFAYSIAQGQNLMVCGHVIPVSSILIYTKTVSTVSSIGGGHCVHKEAQQPVD
jgi:hypothetical protein